MNGGKGRFEAFGVIFNESKYYPCSINGKVYMMIKRKKGKVEYLKVCTLKALCSRRLFKVYG